MLKVIKTEQEYELVLERAYALMQKDIKLNSKERIIPFYLHLQLKQLNLG